MRRGVVHHVDLTVRDPWSSRAFYETVLGFMGYRTAAEHEHGFDMDLTDEHGLVCSIGLLRARSEDLSRPHDRYTPGLHHLALVAASREDVDALYKLLQAMDAEVLDPPALYPKYGPEYYAVFFSDPDGLKLEYVFSR